MKTEDQKMEFINKITDIIDELCKEYRIPKPELVVTFKKIGPRWIYGYGRCHYNITEKTVYLVFEDCNYTFTNEKKIVILHEFAHHIDRSLNGFDRTKSGKYVHHGKTFSEIVYNLYLKYSLIYTVLDKHIEYRSVKNYIKKKVS